MAPAALEDDHKLTPTSVDIEDEKSENGAAENAEKASQHEKERKDIESLQSLHVGWELRLSWAGDIEVK